MVRKPCLHRCTAGVVLMQECLQRCREVLRRGAEELYSGYRQYISRTAPSWVQAVDETSVRQVNIAAHQSDTGGDLLPATCTGWCDSPCHITGLQTIVPVKARMQQHAVLCICASPSEGKLTCLHCPLHNVIYFSLAICIKCTDMAPCRSWTGLS